jgi:hypothetical protein
MRYQILMLFTLTIILASCGADYQYGEDTLNLSASLPKRWSQSRLPVQLKVTSSFDSDSFNSINNMGQQWNDANTQGDFFSMTHNGVERNYDHADKYLDGEMGIYNLTTWPTPLPSEALAVTQTFSTIKTDNSGNQFVEIFHVDVLLNNEDHTIANTKTAGSYYLQTIMIHELGHAIGLKHYEGYWENSVMTPSISTLHSFNKLYDYDKENIDEHYYGVSSAGRQFVVGAQSSGEDIHVESSLVPGTNIIRTVYEIRKSHLPKFLLK